MHSQRKKSSTYCFAFLPAVVLSMIVLVGCQGLTTPTNPAVVSATLTAEAQSTKTPEQRQLEENVWILQSINGEPALPNVEVTLEFALDLNVGRVVKGTAGCNLYGGPYKITDNRLEIDRLISSAKGCLPESIMKQEKRYYEILSHISRYSIEGNTLTFRTETGETLVFLAEK